MKKIICIAFISLNQLVSAQGTVSTPELSIMYTGWNNKIVAAATGMERCEISVEGGTADTASWSDNYGNYFKGYYVHVASGAKLVSITLTGIDEDSRRHAFGTFSYKVKAFPNAQVSGSTISKSTGFIANVGLGADSPFTGVVFNVIGGFIDDVPFSGKVVPGSAVAKVKTGKKVAIEILYTRNGVKSSVNASGILRVVD